jgi:hypothetical protein
MSTTFRFRQRIHIQHVKAPAKSLGAHLASKLQMFGTDERTLTDELCDMLCIWLGRVGADPSSPPLIGTGTFVIDLSKTTARQEVRNGADLELIVSSPFGMKRCLIQAKVLDPTTQRLRCDSTVGWSKLRKQLVAVRVSAGDLAFLLVYVPAVFLNQNYYGFSTYEQHIPPLGHPGRVEAYFGATLIPVNDLLGPSGAGGCRVWDQWKD